jgi:hypothetical protein
LITSPFTNSATQSVELPSEHEDEHEHEHDVEEHEHGIEEHDLDGRNGFLVELAIGLVQAIDVTHQTYETHRIRSLAGRPEEGAGDRIHAKWRPEQNPIFIFDPI